MLYEGFSLRGAFRSCFIGPQNHDPLISPDFG